MPKWEKWENIVCMPAIHFHRRHGRSCELGRPRGSYTAETEEDSRRPACSCPIFAHGTLAGVHRKVATKQRTWLDARRMIEPCLEAGTWELPLTPLRLRLAVASSHAVEEALLKCLAAQESLVAAVSLLRDYQRSQEAK